MSPTLQRVQGPECPKCGCRASLRIREYESWGKPWETRRCDYCFKTWNAEVISSSAAATYERKGPADKPADGIKIPRERTTVALAVKCPKCGSEHTRVTSTRRPIRHHKCKECGKCFKTNESGA